VRIRDVVVKRRQSMCEAQRGTSQSPPARDHPELHVFEGTAARAENGPMESSVFTGAQRRETTGIEVHLGVEAHARAVNGRLLGVICLVPESGGRVVIV
jgi:hypothetical protein